MSTQDEVGDIYPRIGFAQDNFGHSIDHLTVEPGGGVKPEEAGGSDRPAIAAGKGADEGKMFRNFEAHRKAMPPRRKSAASNTPMAPFTTS